MQNIHTTELTELDLEHVAAGKRDDVDIDFGGSSRGGSSGRNSGRSSSRNSSGRGSSSRKGNGRSHR
jgi:hypothetical protein